jgi:hypothetical protein
MEKRTRKLERQTREAYLFLFRELFSRGTRTGPQRLLKLITFRLSNHYATPVDHVSIRCFTSLQASDSNH